MIEICNIPKDKYKIFFEWASVFRSDGVVINADDDSIWYCVSNKANTGLIAGKIFTTPLNKAVIKLDPSKMVKTITNDLTLYMRDNLLVYNTKNSSHEINTLVDNEVKTMQLPSSDKLKYDDPFIITSEEFSELNDELLKTVNSKKDSNDDFINFIYENKKLLICNSDVNDKHSYTFPREFTLDNNLKSEFSVDLVMEATKHFKDFQEIQIYLGNNLPLKFVYRDETSEFITMIAPRIEK